MADASAPAAYAGAPGEAGAGLHGTPSGHLTQGWAATLPARHGVGQQQPGQPGQTGQAEGAQSPAAVAQPRRSLEDIEIFTIRQAVDAAGGNISEAAKALGISRNTIYRKLRWNVAR
jgi:transcriptional regulator of acetoin/glycerol metabolism